MRKLATKVIGVCAIGIAVGVGFATRHWAEREAGAQEDAIPNAEPGTAAVPAAVTSSEVPSDEVAAASLDEMHARLNSRFDDEGMLGASEEDKAVREIVDAFDSPEISECSLLAAECRSQTCKLRTRCAGNEAERAAFGAIFGIGRKPILARTGDVLVSKREIGGGGEAIATVFLARGGSVMDLLDEP